MKLISMTDFVFNQDEINGGFGQEEIDKVWNYAKFLKQPLILGMFVPCDFNGNILPDCNKYISCEKGMNYGLAKERVLFEEFKWDNREFAQNKQLQRFDEELIKNKTIEDLVKYNLTLTDNAIKSIGL
jgi:hypothetical protein